MGDRKVVDHDIKILSGFRNGRRNNFLASMIQSGLGKSTFLFIVKDGV